MLAVIRVVIGGFQYMTQTASTTALLQQFVLDQEIVLSAKRPKADLLESMKQLRDPVYLAKAKRNASADELFADVL